MYLRHVRRQGRVHFVLRETYRDGGVWRHRDLMNLGPDPEAFIEYPGGNGYYFKPELEERLETEGVCYSAQELEEIFLPFMDPHIRGVIERFGVGRPQYNPWRNRSPDELLRHQRELHSFDKRRLHYLRVGRIDIGELEGRSWKFLNVLLGKSRDEIEHTIEGMERLLKPHEVKTYIYTALNLESHFPHHLLRHHPAALDRDRVDEYFLRELCRLNEDTLFFRGTGEGSHDRLHPYLVRYAILYFDHDFAAESLHESLMDFIRKRSYMPRPPERFSMGVGEACKVFGLTDEEFRRMDRQELQRIFRRHALDVHPDRGGEHEAFVRISEAYERLLALK